MKKRLEKEYPNIEFTGWKSKDEVKEYMKGARALIFPSLWYEGAPLTPLEAMSFGVPCLISDCCAGREYIEDKKNGYIFKDIKELKEKVLNVNQNKLDIKIKENNNFSTTIYLNRIIKVYEE